MSKIKSALELALERTVNVTVDKESVRKDEMIKKGKKIAGRFLNNPSDVSFDAEWKNHNKQERLWIKKGVRVTLLANINLPRVETDISRLQNISKGFQVLANKDSGNREIQHWINQLHELFTQYLRNIGQMEESLKNQWQHHLREKEQALREQTGQAITLLPEQDPEFVAVLSEQISNLNKQYNEAMTQGKDQLEKCSLSYE